MNIYKVNDIAQLIKGNSYVGRGIVIGKSEDGKKAENCSAELLEEYYKRANVEENAKKM